MKVGIIVPIKLMLQSAFWHSSAKIILLLVLSLAIPLNILLTQYVVDSLTGFVSGGETAQALILWGSLLVVSMAVVAFLGGYVGNILEISLARKLTKTLSPRFLDKFRRLSFSCFEDSEAMDILHKPDNSREEAWIRERCNPGEVEHERNQSLWRSRLHSWQVARACWTSRKRLYENKSQGSEVQLA